MSTATCHSQDCPSAEIPATVPPALLGAEILCGSCGFQITDISEAAA